MVLGPLIGGPRSAKKGTSPKSTTLPTDSGTVTNTTIAFMLLFLTHFVLILTTADVQVILFLTESLFSSNNRPYY